MDLRSSRSKRKQNDTATTGDLLHPGEWRGRKKARTPTPSRSPSASGGSTTGTSAPQSHRNSRDPSPCANIPPASDIDRPTTVGPSSNTMTNTTTPAKRPKNTAWSGLEQALQALRLTAKACPPLHLAVEDLKSCLPLFEAAAKNRQDYEDLATGLKDMVGLLAKYLHNAASENVANSIADIAGAIRREIEVIGKHQSRDGLRRVLRATSDEEDLIRRYRRIEQLFRQLQGEASLSTWNITSKHFINTQLESLRPAELARYNSELSTEVSRRACTENTRIEILENISKWSEDPRAASIYWMNGMAGTGKTTIAYSACEALETSKQLAASFFCTRTSPECRDAKRIVPTIAYQLARRSAPFRSALCGVLEENTDIRTATISDKFSHLLGKPLMEAKDKMPNNLVIVIDALDECDDPYIVELFLGLLFRSAADLPIKFFVTSRPEPAIRHRMLSESERSRSILHLHEIEKSLVQADIEIYLKEELGPMKPADHDVKRLAQHAGNLFIYAATAVRYIRPPGKFVDSQERLETLLKVNAESNMGLMPIDKLYSVVLATAIEENNLEPKEQERMRLVIWTVVCACEPVLINTIAAISGIGHKNKAMVALEPLRSVLHVTEHSELVTTLHASFPDFILNQERSGWFACNVPMQHQLLSKQCFGIMNAQLRFNICDIQSSFLPDDEVPGLKERIDTNISEELFYACRFWIDHLSSGVSNTNNSSDTYHPLLPMLNDFLSKKLLFWMEVLNLKKCISIGAAGTTRLIGWLSRMANNNLNSRLREIAFDAQAFVVGYASRPISKYTPHIYLSALPFAPSLIHYLPNFKGIVKASGTLLNRIGLAALGIWESEFPALSAAFSPNGEHIVFGNEGGELCVRNAYDGKHVILPFKAHGKPITCVGVSRDGLEIVTGSEDMTLSVWSTRDGSRISGPFKGHSASIKSVAFSPNGSLIASGSNDGIVGIWDPHDAPIATPMRLFRGHTKGVDSVAFSPDGINLASGSSDFTVYLWDVFKGAKFLLSEAQSHIECMMSVRFSPDGSKVISFSSMTFHTRYDRTKGNLNIWNLTSAPPQCSQQQLEFGWTESTSIAVAPSLDVIATSASNSIRVWSTHTGALLAGPFNGHTSTIESISFSEDGTRLISSSQDKTVGVWNVHGRAYKAEISAKHWESKAKLVAFSPDHSLFAFGDLTRVPTVIYVYDLNLHKTVPIDITSTYHGLAVLVQFSYDGTRIFSIHTSAIMCSWDRRTARPIDGQQSLSTSNPLHLAICSANGIRTIAYRSGEVEVWDVQSNCSVAVFTLGVPHDRIVSLSCSLDGKTLLTNAEKLDGTMNIWDAGSAFSLDDRILLTNTENLEGTVDIWDAESGTHIAGPYGGMRGLGISPDGRYAICCSTSTHPLGKFLLIDTHADTVGTTFIPLHGTHDNPNGASAGFSSDGLYLAYAANGRCYIRNMRDKAIVSTLTLGDSDDTFKLVTCSPNGWCIASGHPSASGQDITRAWRLHVDGPRFLVRSDGWLMDSRSRPLLWVPPEIRSELPRSSGTFVENGDVLCVDYDNMFVGDDWSRCYVGG